MSKKAIMLAIYAVNIIIFLVCSMLEFCMFPLKTVEEDKTIVTVKWTQKLENDAYIDMLYDIADEISGDLMVRNLADNDLLQYYRTENDPGFIALEGLDPGQTYATDPQNGEQKIRGFFFLSDSDFQIAPLKSLKGKDIDLSIQQFLVSTDKLNAFSQAVTAKGLELSTEKGISIAGDFGFLYRILAALAFFLAVSVVFYAFSRSKDMIVKKTMGFSDMNIAAAEIKENFSLLLLITAVLLLTAFIVFSALSGAASTLYFLKKNLLRILLYLGGTFLLFLVFIYLVSTQCSISSSKGKSFNKQLFAFTVVFKTVVIILLSTSLTTLIQSAGKVYTMYHATKKPLTLLKVMRRPL